MALNEKYLDKLPYKTYVLLGDSEMAEGSQWEAMELAADYKLDNLAGVIDVNRLGQRGKTMYAAGGLGEAVKGVLSGLPTPVYSLAVTRRPRSGKPTELLNYEDISSEAVVRTIKEKLR
jgi:transketolase